MEVSAPGHVLWERGYISVVHWRAPACHRVLGSDVVGGEKWNYTVEHSTVYLYIRKIAAQETGFWPKVNYVAPSRCQIPIQYTQRERTCEREREASKSKRLTCLYFSRNKTREYKFASVERIKHHCNHSKRASIIASGWHRWNNVLVALFELSLITKTRVHRLEIAVIHYWLLLIIFKLADQVIYNIYDRFSVIILIY